MDKEQNDSGFVAAVHSAFPGRLHRQLSGYTYVFVSAPDNRMDKYMLVLPKERIRGKKSRH